MTIKELHHKYVVLAKMSALLYSRKIPISEELVGDRESFYIHSTMASELFFECVPGEESKIFDRVIYHISEMEKILILYKLVLE